MINHRGVGGESGVDSVMSKWTTNPLASLCIVFGDGDWIESKDQSPDGVRLVQTGNVGEGEFKDRAEKARFVSQETFTRLRCTEIFAGDCLISRLPDPAGRACLIPETGERMITSVDCTIVRFNLSKLLPEFFVYYSQAGDYLAAVEREATGTTRKRISRTRLGQIQIPLAPIPEQRRIVAILDEAFEAIATAKANAERNLRNAREVFHGLLCKVFSEAGEGWSVGHVGTVANCCLGKMLDKAKNKGDPKPYLRNMNVRWFEFDLSDVQEMRFTADEHERYSVCRGDVVICEGGYPGRAAIWESNEPIFIQKALHRVRFKEPILGRWFLYYLYSQEVSGALRQYFTGTGIQHFTGAALARLSLPLAPSTVTAALVDRFDTLAEEVTRLEEIYRKKLAALDELKKSLLHRAFSGQL
jgi:type I restriction enzyme S subunit